MSLKTAKQKIAEYNEKHRQRLEKQTYFLKQNGRLKFGMDKKKLERDWKNF